MKSEWPKYALWIFILTLAVVVRVQFYHNSLNSPLQLEQALEYQVKPGATLRQVSRELAAQGILKQPGDLILHARLNADANRIQAGEYLLSPGLSPLQFLDKLKRGDMLLRQVTLVEGWTVQQALAAIHASPHVVKTLPAGDLEALAQALSTQQHPEGLFFPDTYLFTRGATDRQILEQARERMRRILDEEWSRRDTDLPYANPYEALIMASIVEKETGVGAERERIAGVFVRRLRLGMRLQTDPTVIYGLGPDFSGNLTRAGLQTDTPYNTYLRAGLPPTPIAMPGRGAIAASLHPAEEDTLYFVARGDGTHHFSATLEEHNAAVRHYQVENRAQNYQSAPPATAIGDTP